MFRRHEEKNLFSTVRLKDRFVHYLYVYVMGKMFMLPDNKVIAYSDLYVNCSPKAIGISMIGTSMPANTTEGIQHLAKYIAESMMKKAGVQK